jgi:Uma2 family endonuclease
MPLTSHVARPLVAETRHLYQVENREGYEVLNELVGDRRDLRLTYDARRGVVELMTPGQDHEQIAENLGYLIVAVAEELGLPVLNLATTTWSGPAGALQADKCFYLANFDRVWRKKIDLTVDPPPDLAIEVEISRPKVPKESIYAALRVPELWRIQGNGALTFWRLEGDQYHEVEDSVALPFLRRDEILLWLDRYYEFELGQIEWAPALRAWIREELAPRLGERGE